MLDTLLLVLEDGELLLFTLNLSISLLVFLSQLVDVGIACTHGLGVTVQESSVLDQVLLELVIFLSQLRLLVGEFELGLSEVLLLGDVGLLVLVHLSALVKETSGGGDSLELVGLHNFLVCVVVHFKTNLN